MSTVITGRLGEDAAADYLQGLGWRIVDRNWRCPHGEVDIVAVECAPGERPTVVFVEVKYRRGHAYGDPLEAITLAKQKHLRRTAAAWILAHGHVGRMRIDAIGIMKVPGQAPLMRHIRGLS